MPNTTDELSTQEREDLINSIWNNEEVVMIEPDNSQEPGLEYSQDEIKPEVHPAIQKILDEQNQKLQNLDKLEQRLKSAEGRIGSVQNTLQAAKAAENVPNAPSQTQIQQASRNEKAWTELKEEFPEFANELDKTLIENKTAFNELNQRISNLPDSSRINEIKSEIEKEFSIKLLGMKHKDWKSIVNSQEYNEWIQTQDDNIKNIHANSCDPLECIEVLDKFTSRTKSVKDNRQDRLSRSVNTKTQRATPSTKDLSDMSDDEYRNHLVKKLWE